MTCTLKQWARVPYPSKLCLFLFGMESDLTPSFLGLVRFVPVQTLCSKGSGSFSESFLLKFET
jgi:hypothetical protein